MKQHSVVLTLSLVIVGLSYYARNTTVSLQRTTTALRQTEEKLEAKKLVIERSQKQLQMVKYLVDFDRWMYSLPWQHWNKYPKYHISLYVNPQNNTEWVLVEDRHSKVTVSTTPRPRK